MKTQQKGFTLIELITVLILVGILSVVLLPRMNSVGSAAIQSSRDDIIAALFFAQQQAMMRSNITLELTANSVTVYENNVPLKVGHDYYPLIMPSGVSLPAVTLAYDKLGRTSKTEIELTGTGNSSGVSATIQVEASGYAYAK